MLLSGGYNEKGRKDPYMIRFVFNGCKNQKKLELTKEHITQRSKINKDYKNIVVLEFLSEQNFVVYKKTKEGKKQRKTIENVRVRFEVDNIND